MRVMVIVKATTDPAGRQSHRVPEIGRFNEALVHAGVMLAAEGLRAGSNGARVTFAGGTTAIVDGPVGDTDQPVVGLWLWQVKSLDEAIEWARRGPFDDGTDIEIRQVFEAEAFAAELAPGVPGHTPGAEQPTVS